MTFISYICTFLFRLLLGRLFRASKRNKSDQQKKDLICFVA